jgi:hypothetical protein
MKSGELLGPLTTSEAKPLNKRRHMETETTEQEFSERGVCLNNRSSRRLRVTEEFETCCTCVGVNRQAFFCGTCQCWLPLETASVLAYRLVYPAVVRAVRECANPDGLRPVVNGKEDEHEKR